MQPDHGEQTYRGSGRLEGKRTVDHGGDSGIGRAVAIAFAREGADVLITHLEAEKDDAEETARWVREAGRSVGDGGDGRARGAELPRRSWSGRCASSAGSTFW